MKLLNGATGGGHGRIGSGSGFVSSFMEEVPQALPVTVLWDPACNACGTSLLSCLRAIVPAMVPVSSPEVLHVALGTQELGLHLPITLPAFPGLLSHITAPAVFFHSSVTSLCP